MPKPKIEYQHADRFERTIHTGDLVAFTMAYANSVYIGRVTRQTRSRIRIEFVNQYRSSRTGELTRYDTQYQARPEGVIVLNNIAQEMTVLALKGLIK